MKLLTFVPSFIKDAAKAVKRISQKEFKEVVDNTLTELLGIATLFVKMYALRREGNEDVLHLWCAHRDEMALCPRCGSISTDVYQEEHRCIRHLDVWCKKTFLHFLSRRFKCDQCDKVFTEELPFVESHRRQSTAFEMRVYQSCLTGTRKAVAVREGLSQSTVKEIFNRMAALNKSASAVGGTIRVLGIDEISLKKRHKQFILVISDISRKCILAVLPDREKQTLENWIDTLPPQTRKSIRFVSIDMWAPYFQAARNKLPWAKVVVDRFLDTWCLKAAGTGDKFLAKFLKTFRNWREQILNYFNERITNGFVEGTNNALRGIIRMAFGYRNFANFKLRVLAGFSTFHANPR
jgi:transposase